MDGKPINRGMIVWIIILLSWHHRLQVSALLIDKDDYVRAGVGVTLLPEEKLLYAVSDTRPIVFSVMPPGNPKMSQTPNKLERCDYPVKSMMVLGSSTFNQTCRRHARSTKYVVDELNMLTATVTARYKNLERILNNMAIDFSSPKKRAPGLLPFMGTAFSYLFGLSTSDQLETLKRHVIKTNDIVRIAAQERKETLNLLTILNKWCNIYFM